MINLSTNTIYIAIVICLVGLLIVLAPIIVSNNKVRNFTIDTFNLVLLLFVAVILFFLDVRIGTVFTVLLLTFLAYAKLDKFTVNMSNNLLSGDETEYVKQFDLLTSQIDESKESIVGNKGCNNNNTPPSEQFKDVNTADTKRSLPIGTAIDETTTHESPVNEDTALISNVSSYMNQLQQDNITNKLKTVQANYDVVSCRYDMADTAQNTTLNGSPLGWNDTYKNNIVNGQLFYPLHG
jgi:Ca2+/Na+ antiporter